MIDVNKVILMGRVGQDAEVKEVGENKVAKFSLATSESFKDKSGEWQEKTAWHTVTVWNKSAEYAEKHCKKGVEAAVEGKINYNSYTPDGGETKYFTEINASSVKFRSAKTETKTEEIAATVDSDSLPF